MLHCFKAVNQHADVASCANKRIIHVYVHVDVNQKFSFSEENFNFSKIVG
jgi:hypothetical protein